MKKAIFVDRAPKTVQTLLRCKTCVIAAVTLQLLHHNAPHMAAAPVDSKNSTDRDIESLTKKGKNAKGKTEKCEGKIVSSYADTRQHRQGMLGL